MKLARNLQKALSRLTAAQAGYMELAGAVKDGDCKKVKVEGGISKERGCCNEFQPEDGKVAQFRCGKCVYED